MWLIKRLRVPTGSDRRPKNLWPMSCDTVSSDYLNIDALVNEKSAFIFAVLSDFTRQLSQGVCVYSVCCG